MSQWKSEAGPIQTRKVNKCLEAISSQHGMHRELSGVIGVDEHSSAFWQPIGGKREDVTLAWQNLGEKYAWTITRANYQQVIDDAIAAQAELVKNMPTIDNRRTPEQEAAAQAERMAAKQKNEAWLAARELAFAESYADMQSGQVAISSGQMAVCLALCYDDSDIQSDYFNRHASIGRVLLAIVPRQAQTQALARSAVARFPELAGVNFEWKTENYSGGHGNYLISPGFELPAKVAELFSKRVGHWEVVFNSYDKNLRPFKGYPGVRLEAVSPAVSSAGNGVTVRHNSEHNGVEVAFPSKPDAEIISRLKAAGFRWSIRSKVWYKKLGAYAWAQAHTIAGIEPAPPMPGERTEPDRFDMAVEDQMAAQCGL